MIGKTGFLILGVAVDQKQNSEYKPAVLYLKFYLYVKFYSSWRGWVNTFNEIIEQTSDFIKAEKSATFKKLSHEQASAWLHLTMEHVLTTSSHKSVTLCPTLTSCSSTVALNHTKLKLFVRISNYVLT